MIAVRSAHEQLGIMPISDVVSAAIAKHPAVRFNKTRASGDREGCLFVESTPYVVGWGTLALINAGLAQGKGHSGLAWFLLSLLLGPIATLILVLLPISR